MKRSVQFLAAPLLIGAFFALNAFQAPPKNIANGGGFTSAGVYFNFNAVQQKDGYKGHVSYGELSGAVTCVFKGDGFASIYFLVEGSTYAITVIDVGEGSNKVFLSDMISTPVMVQPGCDVHFPDDINFVEGGNIQVHK